MKLALIIGVAAVGFSGPAFAIPVFEGPVGAAHEILRQLSPEGDDGLYRGEYKGEQIQDLADDEEESSEDTFRCRVMAIVGSPIKCVSSTP
jgi:hypothetical protein